ncbi:MULTISPECIES: hypothetical protein [unclassified Empedobacter]|uniref:hypothetical protein n=1 Tax=unclassified Empedobacter TaxID=2643773 RepID=UPI0025C0C491|nr:MULTISPECIES: hypothetical protein [unclassified Empedobacter]
MKKILLSLFIVCSIYSFGQDVDIKKGKISINKKEVATIDGKKKVYTIANIDNVPVATIKWNFEIMPDGSKSYWFTITDLSTNDVNDVVTEGVGNSISPEKIIVETFSKGEYKIFNENGIDKDLLKTLVATNKRNRAEEVSNEKEKIEINLSEVKYLFDNSKLSIDSSGSVLKESKKVGKITFTTFINEKSYELLNSEGIEIGKWKNGIFTLNNGSTYKVEETNNPLNSPMVNGKDKNSKFFVNLVGFALKEGYSF